MNPYHTPDTESAYFQRMATALKRTYTTTEQRRPLATSSMSAGTVYSQSLEVQKEPKSQSIAKPKPQFLKSQTR